MDRGRGSDPTSYTFSAMDQQKKDAAADVSPRNDGDEVVDLDQILTSIGMGSWHLLIGFINILIWTVHGPHTMGSTLFNAPVDFLCFNSSESACNFFSSTELTNATFTYNSACLEIASLQAQQMENLPCTDYANLKFTGDQRCPVVFYDSSVYTHTVTTDWNLICDSSMKRPLFQNMYSIGIIIGCFLVGPISDSIGRARAILIGSAIHIFSSSTVVFVSSYSIVLAARLVVGVSNVFILISAVTYAVENVPVAWRGPVGTFIGMPYSVWMVVFATMAFYVRNWCYLYIVITMPAIFLLPAAMALDESPRWLMQQGMETKACDILLKAATKNKASEETKKLIIQLREQSLEQGLSEFGGEDSTADEKYSVVTGRSQGNSLDVSMQATYNHRPTQFAISIDATQPKYPHTANAGGVSDENSFQIGCQDVSMDSKLNSKRVLSYKESMVAALSKLLNLNKICASKSRIVAMEVAGEIVPFFRTPFMRRITFATLLAKFLCEVTYYGVFFNTNNFASGSPFLYVGLSGIADGTAVIVASMTSQTLSRKLTVGGGFMAAGVFLLFVLAIPQDLMILQWIFVLSGFLMVAVASQVFYVYLPELFPTVLRGKGFAFCNLSGNIGILFAPLVSDVLGEQIWWGPGAFLGSSGLLAGLLSLLLPETKDRKMCETVADVERRGHGKLK